MTKPLNIVADENIPFARELFSPLGNLTLLPGRHMQASDVQAADVLLVRSVTRVNAELLSGSSVKFVGTCTIGVDHLDIAFLEQQGIAYASAPGCNAMAVAQYVLAALATVNRLQASQTAVVIGGGNVGSKVYQHLEHIGLQTYCVDPFISADKGMTLANFEKIYDADVICLHTPLTRDGKHPTLHMLDETVLQRLKPNAVLLNAGRGGVIDNEALYQLLGNRSDLTVILDVWETEPDIHRGLLSRVSLATPHIAGYSFEGRVTGSFMIYQALCKFMGRSEAETDAEVATARDKAFGAPLPVCIKSLHGAILNSYLLSEDHKALHALADALPASFDRLRKNYPQRREFSHFHLFDVPNELRGILAKLGFVLELENHSLDRA